MILIALDSLEENTFDNKDILHNVHPNESENIERDKNEDIVPSVWG